jgi:hypothetical protein
VSFLGSLLGLEPTQKGAASGGDDSFESEVLDSLLPVLIDPWGLGYAPCERLAPVANDLAKQHSTRQASTHEIIVTA